MLSRKETTFVLAWAAVEVALVLTDVALTLAPEVALAVNQTTVSVACDTVCGRVKQASVVFADGVVCGAFDVMSSNPLMYESAAAAVAAWDAQHPPFAMTRFRPRWAPEMSCFVRSGPLTMLTFAVTLLCAASPVLLIICIRCMRELARPVTVDEHEAGVAAGVHARQDVVGHPAPLPFTLPSPLHVLLPPPLALPPPLPRFTASLVAAAALARGDRCAVSLDPLDNATLMVPVCGHVVTEAVAVHLHKCPQCGDAPLAFARVPASVVVRVGAQPAVGAEGADDAAAAAAAAAAAPT